MPTLDQVIPYIYGAVSIFLILFIFIAYTVWRTKRMLKKAIENENQAY